MEKISAGLYQSAEYVEVGKIEKPTIETGEARVKVKYAGICGTDMMIFSGKHPRATAPLAMGHEFSGVIDDMQGSSAFSTGDRVVIEPTLSCGTCEACQNGNNHVCKELQLIGIDKHGGFAEYVKVPVDRLHPIPEKLPDTMAALTEPVAVAVHTVRRSDVNVGQTVAVLGAGPIGLLTGIIAKLAGAKEVIISDVSPYRLDKAEEMGLTPVDARHKDIKEEVMDRTMDKGADVVFEVAGNSVTAKQMVDLAKIQGQIVVVSVYKQPPEVNLAAMHFKEISLTTTRCYSHDDFKTAIAIMADELDLSGLISHVLPLDDIEKGFSLMKNPDNALKILIQPEREE
ncbi:zinc-binding dehydrogenase [Salibacterium salarium]|uniref:Zinc-binding dehydrogenase n=1 Tax=Salibacterium salarium TaxID=284579 RepID=A0A3R9PG54_9BACI|nr:alcohol dehydrogenase catalytic domain-containing protein [Salibacterium salarium]RSL30004.1 zinc-binding dehydrogenase [Salibacterium salarium]